MRCAPLHAYSDLDLRNTLCVERTREKDREREKDRLRDMERERARYVKADLEGHESDDDREPWQRHS